MSDDPVDIVNWRRLDERVTTSGQPTSAQLADIAGLGVKHIINLALHTHEKALPDERGDVTRLGMVYTHLPVEFAAPTEADFEAFRAAFEATSPDRVHVHCIFNWRVSAFFYRYRRDVLGLDPTAIQHDLDAIWAPDPVWAAFIGDTKPS
jgi:protein tyrosine phosphatase (PTP) superfamily phosphohydrolase (DUF442 family)